MKTIFSYFAKCLVVYTISFTLLQVQVLLPVQSLRHAPGFVQAQEITTEEDGVRSEKNQATLDGEDGSVAMDVVTMMALGYFTSRLLFTCKPYPTDVMIAAAGGIAYIAAEIVAFNAFKEIKDSKTLEFKVREDGENTEQVEYLKEQKKGYEDIAKTAKTKKMIQTAAAAAYFVAAGTAWIKKAMLDSTAIACSTCPGATSGSVAALKATDEVPAPSVGKGPSLLKLCTAVLASQKADLAAWTTACTASSGAGSAACLASFKCGSATVSCSGLGAMCASETAICLPVTIASNDNSESIDAAKNFVKNNLVFDELDLGISESDIAEAHEEIQVEEIQRKYSIASFIESNNPLYDLNKSLEINGSNVEEQLNSYVENRDRIRFFKGEIRTASIDEYNTLKESFYSQVEMTSTKSYKESFTLALNYGLDLLIPSANANSFMTILGGAAGIVIAALMGVSQTIDTFLATPTTRGVAWMISAGLAMASASRTGKIQEKAEENAEKIQDIINRLNQIKSLATDQLSGQNMAIPTKIPFAVSGNDPILIDEKKLPCATTDSNKTCQKIVPDVQNSHGFASLGGTMGTLATDAAKMGDDLFGNDTIAGSGVDNMVSLGNKNEGIQNKVRSIKKKLNDQLVKNGGKAIDFDKMNDKLLAKIRKKTRDSLRRSGKTPEQVLASLGSPSTSSEEKKEEVAIKGPSEAKPTTGGKVAAKKAPVFSLDLGDDENSGVSADDVAANQNAANAMNEEAVDDIVTKKDVSIFKVISVRYLKSGFSRLLEEQKKASKE